MGFSSQTDLSPEEIFDISQEISQVFAPVVLANPIEFIAAASNSSPQTLLEISEEIIQDYAPALASQMPGADGGIKLSSREILAISEEVSLGFVPEAADAVSQVVLLPVDRDHLHAYWNIGQEQLEASPQDDHSESQLTLRVYSEPDNSGDISKTVSWFDVAIDSTQTRQIVSLPVRSDQQTYSASIGNQNIDSSFAALASSNAVAVFGGHALSRQSTDARIAPSESVPQLIATSGKTKNSSKSASGQSNRH
ncbi:MAG: DUF4912 domain-containing protein [Methylococcaceae bacterium]